MIILFFKGVFETGWEKSIIINFFILGKVIIKSIFYNDVFFDVKRKVVGIIEGYRMFGFRF